MLLAVAATLTLGAGARAAAAQPALPTVPSLPTLPVTAPPLPSLPLPSLPLPSLPLPSLPLPTPLPTVTGIPAPLGSPPAGQPPGAGAPGPGSTAPSGGTGSPPIVQASLFDGLLGLLGTPANVGVERPSLEHFDVSASLASSRVSPPARGVGGAGSPAPVVLTGLVVAGLLVVIGVAVTRQHRRRLSRLRAAMAGPLVLLAAVMTVATAQGTWFPAKPAAATTAIVTSSGLRTPVEVAHAVTAGSALFSRLVGFETQVGAIETALQSPPAGQGVAMLRGERILGATLEAVEQQEYAFYSATAQDPAQAGALMQAAATQPAATRNAVSYDVQAVQAQLAQQAAIAQASQNNTAPASSLPVSGVEPAPNSAPLAWPMSGVITQGFGPNQVAIEPSLTLAGITYAHFHTGIDIASALGTPVQAAAAGVVALAGSEVDGLGHLVGYGNYVVVAHGVNLITLYGHLEQLLVHAGQTVRAGDPIGLEGSTGNSTGPHVHFELRVHGVPTDPTPYVRAH
jgi:murein DD-endopeptidase MepM/ murein hydrolase activator NlpD